jgi:hypothetical protein
VLFIVTVLILYVETMRGFDRLFESVRNNDAR